MDEVIERTGIQNVRNRRISTLSKGYKQRAVIAQALLRNPQVIILDEPAVIFSSLILSEVQAICDRMLMIARDKLVAFGEPEELQKRLLSPGSMVRQETEYKLNRYQDLQILLKGEILVAFLAEKR